MRSLPLIILFGLIGAMVVGFCLLGRPSNNDVSLSVIGPKNDVSQGEQTVFLITNRLGRPIEYAIGYFWIKEAGSWRPVPNLMLSKVGACLARSSSTFSLAPPTQGEAWRVTIMYIPLVNHFEGWLHQQEKRWFLRWLGRLDQRKYQELVSPEIRK
jgi:hypothetical protein